MKNILFAGAMILMILAAILEFQHKTHMATIGALWFALALTYLREALYDKD